MTRWCMRVYKHHKLQTTITIYGSKLGLISSISNQHILFHVDSARIAHFIVPLTSSYRNVSHTLHTPFCQSSQLCNTVSVKTPTSLNYTTLSSSSYSRIAAVSYYPSLIPTCCSPPKGPKKNTLILFMRPHMATVRIIRNHQDSTQRAYHIYIKSRSAPNREKFSSILPLHIFTPLKGKHK